MNTISVIITDDKIYGTHNKSIIYVGHEINRVRAVMFVHALQFSEVSLNEFKVEDASIEDIKYYLQSKP
jgi:hypothetical protein